jgi:phospholipase C
MRPTRRQTLQGLSALAATSALGCKPESAADEVPVEPASRVKTWVIVMMENRSFDHYFGALSLDEGRTDVDGLTPAHTNPDADGNPVPAFPLDRDCLDDPPHGWSSSHDQHAEGANSGFVLAHHGGVGEVSREVMGYYGRTELPMFYALADQGALCQRWFASVMGPTWPNRFYSLCGTSLGGDNNNFSQVPFTAKSIFRQLDEAGITWRIYATDVPFAALLADVGTVRDDTRVVHIDQFYWDAEHGQLPTVCIVEPGYTFNDDHPPHAIALGQLFVGSVYKALADSPQWEGSAMIVDYDEHGGFYDHVPPPTTDDDYADLGFDQLGFRIPGLVVGPWAKTAVVDTVYDHTSVLSTLQDAFGLDRLSARNAAANPLWDCFDLDAMRAGAPRAPITLPTMEVDEEALIAACGLYAAPGQHELDHMADTGQIRPAWDFRGRLDETIARQLARAEKMGLLKVRPTGR